MSEKEKDSLIKLLNEVDKAEDGCSRLLSMTEFVEAFRMYNPKKYDTSYVKSLAQEKIDKYSLSVTIQNGY